MKKVKLILCALMSLIVLVAFTACGNDADKTFDGDFKQEATQEEVTAFTTSVQTAITEDDAVETLQKANGVVSYAKGKISYSYGGTTQAVEYDTKQVMAVTDGKVASSTEYEMKQGDEKINMGIYFTDGKIYIKQGDKKLYIDATTPIIGEEVADLMEDLVESATMIDQLEQYTDLLVDLDVEAINEAGIKLYIDKDKNFTKVKYAFSQESMADVLEGVTFDEYSIVIVLDKNNALYGVKVILKNFAMTTQGMTMAMDMEGSLAITDEKPDFPSFKGYETIDSFDDLASIMGE